MDVALPSAARGAELAGALAARGHQASVRGKLLDGVEAVEVGDLVVNRQRERLADARDGAQAVERGEVVALGRAHEIARGAQGSRIGVRQREVPGVQKARDLLGVELVALRLGPVDEAHAEGVAEGEADPFVLTEIGEPAPAEDALAADDQILAERSERLDDRLGLAQQVAVQDDLPGAVEHAKVEGAAVQIDAAREPCEAE